MSHRSSLEVDALIFSCYDVLIDARYSYHEVVRKTAQIYLEQALGLTPSAVPLLTPEEVVLLQKRGIFPNYWDLSKALVMYFIELLPPVAAPTFPSKFHVPAIIAYLQFAGGNLRLSVDALREQKDIAQFATDVAAAGGGLDGAHRVLPKQNRHMVVATGKVTKTNIVGRIFQELYLGADLFERLYQEPAIIVQSTGYAEHESLVMDADILAAISKKVSLAVISDRPRSEVQRSLRARKIDTFFQVIVSQDEIRQAKAQSVPAPWSLLEAARLLRPTPTHSAYIGANIGDVQAAKAANETVPFIAVGCLTGAHEKDELRIAFEQQKATMILGHPNHLKEVIID
jgi:phosphoglycolate phosphatase-like HAD superfamily hydrolase